MTSSSTSPMQNSGEPALIIERAGALGTIRLNRPRVLNSLNLDMVRRMNEGLDQFEREPGVAAVLVTGEGERGLCAGGDIRALYQSGKDGTDMAVNFFAEEYRCNSRIRQFPKPYIAIMDGLVMGGGVGISAHGSHRIVTERTRLAMPETGIGFFPDVGGTWLLSRGPGEFGTWLGLSGETVGAAEAIAAGLADDFVPSDQLPQLYEALTVLPADVAPDGISQTIARFAETAPTIATPDLFALADRAFAFDSMEAIMAALAAEPGAMARKVHAILLTKSPTSLKVTLRLLRMGRTSGSLEDCLQREFAVAATMMRGHDFYEGVRAAVIDKDRNPKWSPPALDKINAADVDAYLSAHTRVLFPS